MLGLEKAAAANGKMGKSKTYCNDYEDYEEGKNAKTLVEDILNDPELPQLEELIIGGWGEEFDESCRRMRTSSAISQKSFSATWIMKHVRCPGSHREITAAFGRPCPS